MVLVFATCFVGGLAFVTIGWAQANRSAPGSRAEAVLAILVGALLLLVAALFGSQSA
jgi:hypothetical protein